MPRRPGNDTPPPRWICDTCRGPLSAGDGYLVVRYPDISDNETAEAAWEAAHPPAPDGYLTVTALELVTYPARVRWASLHRRCDPDLDDARCYWIGIDRLATWHDVASRTAHLLSKDWLPRTDWTDVLYRAGAQ